VTVVPPVVGPDVGSMLEMTGAATYVNSPGCESPLGEVITTSAGPAVPAGVVTVIWVSESTVNDVPAVPSNVTPVAPVNPVPVIVTTVPPVVGPSVGVSELIAGTTAFGPTLAFATSSVSAWVPGRSVARRA